MHLVSFLFMSHSVTSINTQHFANVPRLHLYGFHFEQVSLIKRLHNFLLRSVSNLVDEVLVGIDFFTC